MRLEGWAKGALRHLPANAREHFVLDPLETLRSDLKLTVRAAEHLSLTRDDGGACDGVSYLDDGVVLYAPSQWNKRENFTLAHELGHWLVDRDDKLLDWLADQDQPSRILESVCDAIAQQLLLPDDLVRSAASSPVRAKDILELSDGSAASVPASAIAIAGLLPALGAAITIDSRTREVLSASVHPDPEKGWPAVFPWRGDVLPAEHALAELRDGATLTRKSFWRSKWGRREDFYIDAIGLPNRVVAILSATDIWRTETLSNLDSRTWDERLLGQVTCCGQTRQVRGFPCGTCGQFFCPACGSCSCTKRNANEAECSECHSLVGAHLLSIGKCELCV